MFIQVNLLREKAQRPKNITALRLQYNYKNIFSEFWIMGNDTFYHALLSRNNSIRSRKPSIILLEVILSPKIPIH